MFQRPQQWFQRLNLGHRLNNPAFQPGQLDQRLDQKPELFRLGIDLGQHGAGSGRQRLLVQQLPIEQDICQRGFGLMGNIPNQRFDAPPILLD